MLKYKRIYPMRQNGRLKAIVTIVGGKDASEIFVKFKAKPTEENLYIILFNPKTYEHEMLPITQHMQISSPLTLFTACAVGVKEKMGMDILMDGAISRSAYNVNKLKSIIATELWEDTEQVGNKVQEPNKELLEYVAKMDKQENPPTAPLNTTKDKTAVAVAQEGENAVEVAETPKEEIATIEEMESLNGETDADAENATKEVQTAVCKDGEEEKPEERAEECSCKKIEENIKTANGNLTVMKDMADLPKEIDQKDAKYCEFINPFKDRWNGIWWKVQYPHKSWHYIVGRVTVDNEKVSILGIPGSPKEKPVCMEQSDMYAVADNGTGYWLTFQK